MRPGIDKLLIMMVFEIKDVELFHEVLNPNLFSQFLENSNKIPNPPPPRPIHPLLHSVRQESIAPAIHSDCDESESGVCTVPN